ncbi:MarR family transcriptional regulator [Corynebacterium sp. CNCTC7651]|uniref:MarR family winged helix-turn-helix transcriptional regulator n=1 Tax=Corynebacterium sp. CNCTC7651 TaxID=2815361 RepID=UPI00351D9FDE|nr:MarR family transcriptional regulator [Corynebacterium sp. CNCTC7651]
MAPTGETRPDPLVIAEQIRPAITRLYVSYFRTADHSSLTGPQLSIMHRIADHGPMRVRQLADAEGVRMPTASNTINQLEERGLVYRVRAEQDRRGVLVELTDLGREELQRVGGERNRYVAEMLATLDDEYLHQVAQAADAINALEVEAGEVEAGEVEAGDAEAGEVEAGAAAPEDGAGGAAPEDGAGGEAAK